MSIEEIKELEKVVNRLNYLLSKPEPGLSTWNKLTKMHIEEIAGYLSEEELKRLIK